MNMKKILSSVLTLALIVPISLVPANLGAASPNYVITIDTPVVSANPLTLTGNTNSTNYVGQKSAQHVVINWGDGSPNTEMDIPLANFDTDAGTFDWDWSAIHSYTNTVTQSYTIVVNVCHSKCTGAEGSGDSTDTEIVVIPPSNEAPVATDDSYSTDEDTTFIESAPGVLTNDTDPESDPITAVLVSGPAHGTLTLNSDGSFTYTPSSNYNGPDSFTYKANDGTNSGNTATASITVNAVNDTPVANDDAYSTDEDVVLNQSAPGVLSNDTDIDGNSLTAILVSDVSNGTLTLNSDGSFSYTPDVDFNGADSFTYKANDGTADSNTVTVDITVGGINDIPVTNADSYSTDEDITLEVFIPGVIVNDTDTDGDPLTASLVFDVLNGTLTLNSDGSFTYIPDADYNGEDSFTYKANDGIANSGVAIVTITVNAVNDAPVANDSSVETDEDNAVADFVSAGDIEGDTLTYSVVDGPEHGTLDFESDGSFIYIPDENYNGSDSFTFMANDGSADSNTATVDITVNPVNDAPTIELIGSDVTVAIGNDYEEPGYDTDDIDGDEVTVTTETDLDTDFEGDYTITYTADDGNGGEVTVERIVHVVSDVCPNLEDIQTEIPDGDVIVDGQCVHVAECSTDQTLNEETNTCVDNPPTYQTPSYATPSYQTPNGGGGGNGPIVGSFGVINGQVLGASTVGEVLGESCGLYMSKHVRLGSAKNDAEQVRKLQAFLNSHMNAGLPVTGFYGQMSLAAVKAFQAKYADEVLAPWGETMPTGLVYITTLRAINNIECPDAVATLPALIPWSRNPNAQ